MDTKKVSQKTHVAHLVVVPGLINAPMAKKMLNFVLVSLHSKLEPFLFSQSVLLPVYLGIPLAEL